MAIGDADYWKREKCRKNASNTLGIRIGFATVGYIATALTAARLALLGPVGLAAAAALMVTRHIVFLAAVASAYAFYKIALDDCDKPSPLILDGDGVEADAITFFDHEGDGWRESSGWADEDDGVLVWDRNADGVINDGSELFGDNTVLANDRKAAHGFAALADLDDNGDGVIDSSDTAWTNLQVMRWTDDNNNGMKDDGEEFLVTLDSLAIESLNSGFTNSNHVDSSGNEHQQVGSFTKTVANDDGTTETVTSKMTDVWLVTSTGVTQYDDTDIPEHSEAIAALPDAKGYGRAYNLRDAMALDDATDADGNSRLTAPYYGNSRTETRSLREMVTAFSETDTSGNPNLDKTAREALAENILLRWTGAEGAAGHDYYWRWSRSNTQMSYTTADKVAVVEAFQGEQWLKGQSYRNPAYSTAQILSIN